MPDVEFDEFVLALKRSLVSIQAHFAAQERLRLEQLQQIHESGEAETFEWQLAIDLQDEAGGPPKMMRLPLWSMRAMRSVQLSEFTLDVPVGIEPVPVAASDERLSFVLRPEDQDPLAETFLLKLSWTSAPDDLLRITLDGKTIRDCKGFLVDTKAGAACTERVSP